MKKSNKVLGIVSIFALFFIATPAMATGLINDGLDGSSSNGLGVIGAPPAGSTTCALAASRLRIAQREAERTARANATHRSGAAAALPATAGSAR